MSLVVANGLHIAGRLEETDLTLEAGALTCLVGPNGSGKTSLLHALGGIGDPQGQVRIDGRDPWREPPGAKQRLLTYLPASRDIAWPLRARDLIALGGASDASRVDDLLAQLDLADMAKRRVDRLSTGERARILIGRALLPRPCLLLLDEPAANLDPLWQLRILDLLREEVRARGQAALIAMHDLELARIYADRLIVMRALRIEADGEPAPIFQGNAIADIFGIEKQDGIWRPCL